MTYSEYQKQRILYWFREGCNPSVIQLKLLEEGFSCSKTGIYQFIKRFQKTGTIGRKEGSGRPSKVRGEVEEIVEAEMQRDDETSVAQLQTTLRMQGHNLSLSTILRCRTNLCWSSRGAAYCQLIRDQNKVKRLAWARENMGEEFKDVIWTDETSVQLESHRRFCCRKKSQKPRYKPRFVFTYAIFQDINNNVINYDCAHTVVSRRY